MTAILRVLLPSAFLSAFAVLISVSLAHATPIFVPRDVAGGTVTGLPFSTTSPPALVSVSGLVIPRPAVDAIFDHGQQHLYEDSLLSTFLWQVTLSDGTGGAFTTLVNIDLGEIPAGGTTINQGFAGAQLVQDFLAEHPGETGTVTRFSSVRVIDIYDVAEDVAEPGTLMIVGLGLAALCAVRARRRTDVAGCSGWC